MVQDSVMYGSVAIQAETNFSAADDPWYSDTYNCLQAQEYV